MPPKRQFFRDLRNKLHFGKERLAKSINKDKPSIPMKAHPYKSLIAKIFAKYNLSPQFIISGLLLLVSIIIYFLFLSPLRSESIKLKSDLDSKAGQLEQYLGKGQNIYNEKWIDAKEQEIELVENELNLCKETLAKKDKMIEMVFTDINGDQITDQALWKGYYNKMSSELIESLNRSGFNTNRETMDFRKWDSGLPTLDEIITEQKRFWVQNEIINIIVKNRAFVMGFSYLKFNDVSLSANNLAHNLFTPIPLEIKLEMKQSNMFYLINDILNSGLNFFIETINLESKEDLNYQPERLFDPIYTIIIFAYAMDFI